jgi:site-specific DNA recombinase
MMMAPSMIAAIYARKSNDQIGVADEQKSIARQVDHARVYAARKGWTVDEASIYVDDGISGAEFANRPGFLRLMSALKPRPSFQVLVMSEESRLGREAIETACALKQLVTGGVRVFFYLEDRERTLDSPTDKIMLSLTTFADELEREKARQRTYDAMLRKARAGHVTGGRVFGYDNFDVFETVSGKRSHVERRSNEAEAAIVRRIIELCAAGTGYTRIAKLLNAERAPAPRPQQGRPAGWAPTTVNEILHRTLYRGEVTWNRTRKRNRWGQHAQSARPADEWLRLDVPDLRIVSDELWQAAHHRLAGVRAHLAKVTGGRFGTRARDIESPYLLSGFARCTVCGGGLTVMSRSHGRHRASFYGCLAHHKRGSSVCGNGLVLPIDCVDEAVLGTIAGDVLRPAVVMAILEGVLERMSPRTIARDVDELWTEAATIDREITRLTNAIATGGELAPLLEALKVRQSRRDELAAALTARESFDLRRFDRKALEAKVHEHVDRWRALLTKRVEDGRQLLREVLSGPLRFTPQRKTYRFEGDAAIGRMLAGVAGIATFLASPTGFEPVFWP